MRALAILPALLAGCASLDHAGVASYVVRPVLLDGRAVCCEVAIHNGKQYARLDAEMRRNGDQWEVRLSERGVEAFAGQQHAAEAASGAAGTVAKAAAGIMLAPAAAGVGAAAIGAIAR